MSNNAPKLQSSLIVFLPAFVHLGICLAIWLNHADDTAWQKMLIVDFPFSGIEAGLMFKQVEPVISIGIAGTIWWCLVSLLIRTLIRAYKNRRA
ncbi:MAG: hypothetical protein ACLP56_21205 [Candidatus Sulfotelmatobacter sp.]